jgi:hypothetical protein
MSTSSDQLLRRFLAHHLKSAPPADVARLAESLLAESATDIPRRLSVADGRYRRVDLEGSFGAAKTVPEDRWLATHDRETDIVWTHPFGNIEDGQNHETAMRIATAHTLLDVACDAPDIRQQLSIIDYDLYDPAVPTEYFRGPYGYFWTKTLAKHPAGCAWLVYVDTGHAYRLPQSNHDHVRGVVSGQSLGFRS